jgi:predicted nucleic acid-binding protein
MYDAMIVSAALQAGCETLWSEDMQSGLQVDGSLTISDPFRR